MLGNLLVTHCLSKEGFKENQRFLIESLKMPEHRLFRAVSGGFQHVLSFFSPGIFFF